MSKGITLDERINAAYNVSKANKGENPFKKNKQTNADRIRSFSDEELAEFLADLEIFSPCKNCDFHFVDAMNDDCKAPDGWICTKGYAAALIQKWLQSEVEEIR
ncbi:MAG: hypothetical protein ACI4DL_01660 [Lachnospiraceae bacterium]